MSTNAAGCCVAPEEEFIPIGADAEVYYEDASVQAAGETSYLNAGTVTFVLKDEDGMTVTGSAGSATYDGELTGDYYGTIDADVTATLTADDLYYLEITYTDAAGNDDFRRIPLYARYRGRT